MIQGRVSVIIPAYNYGRYLEEAVRSVQAQSYRDWDITIVDDGSTDDTPIVGARLAKEDPIRIRFYRKENGGVAAARNFAISLSEGEFIMPLDADDVLMPCALQDFVQALRDDPQSGYSYSNLENVNVLPGDQRLWHQGPFMRGRVTLENTAASASMWRRSLFDAGVRYRRMIFEDWDLWLQIIAHGFRAYYIPKVLFQYRLHLSGRTARNRYLYFPGMLEVARANPTIGEAHMVTWAESCLQNSPSCWEKCSVVFLPATESEVARNFSGPMLGLAGAFVQQGHFCAALGSYRSSNQLCDGVALLGIGAFSLDAVLHKLGMLGSSVLVISELSGEFNELIEAQRNISAVVSLRTGEEPSSTLTQELIVRRNRFIWRGEEELTAESVAEKLIEMTNTCHRLKRDEDVNFWDRVNALSTLAHVKTSIKGAADQVTIIVALDEIFSAGITNTALQASLASVRRCAGNARVILLESGTQSLGRPEIQAIAQSHNAEHRYFRRREGYSRSTLINQVLPEIGTQYILIAKAGAIFEAVAFDAISTCIEEFPKQDLFFGECAALKVLAEREFVEQPYSLRGAAFLRHETQPSLALIRTEWLRSIEGFCEELLEEGADLDELRWQAETLGVRLVWLPTALALHPWHISRATLAAFTHNKSVLRRYKQMPRHAMRRLLMEPERSSPLAQPSPERRELEAKLFALAHRVEAALRVGQGGPVAQAQVLAQWGDTCVVDGEHLSARQALEDAEALDPESLDVALGLARVAALNGKVITIGHYASKALRCDPHNQDARTLLEALNVTWFKDSEVVSERG